MSWFTSFKEWLLSWFTDTRKLQILELLQGVNVFIDYARPIVERIDKQLKPLLKLDNTPVFDTIKKFLEEYSDEFDDVVEIANKLKDLPMADLLANVAIECLKLHSSAHVSLSVLRLAVELAYNVYKQSKA